MITNSGFQTLTKIIQDTLRLDIDKHHVSYSVEKLVTNHISIHRSTWFKDKIGIIDYKEVFYCKVFYSDFDERIESAYESIHADIEDILARGNEPCSEQ